MTDASRSDARRRDGVEGAGASRHFDVTRTGREQHGAGHRWSTAALALGVSLAVVACAPPKPAAPYPAAPAAEGTAPPPEAPAAGQVVVDVGINWDESAGRLVGDVDFEGVEPIVSAITPVPGGVGSVTTAILARHVIEAAERTMQEQ